MQVTTRGQPDLTEPFPVSSRGPHTSGTKGARQARGAHLAAEAAPLIAGSGGAGRGHDDPCDVVRPRV